MDPTQFSNHISSKLKSYPKARGFLSLLFVAFILAAIPITTAVVQNTRDLRSKAATGGMVCTKLEKDTRGGALVSGVNTNLAPNQIITLVATIEGDDGNRSNNPIQWRASSGTILNSSFDLATYQAPSTGGGGVTLDIYGVNQTSCGAFFTVSGSPTTIPSPPPPTTSPDQATCSTSLTTTSAPKGGLAIVVLSYTTQGSARWAPGYRSVEPPPNNLNSVGPNNEPASIGGGNSNLTVNPPSLARLPTPGTGTVEMRFYVDNHPDVVVGRSYTFANLVLIKEGGSQVVNCTNQFVITVTAPAPTSTPTPTTTPIAQNTVCSSIPTTQTISVEKGKTNLVPFNPSGGPPPSGQNWAPAVRFVSSERAGTIDINGDGVPDGYKAVDHGLDLGDGLVIKTNFQRFRGFPLPGGLTFTFDATTYTPRVTGTYQLDNLLILDEGDNSVIKLCASTVKVTVTVPAVGTSTPTLTQTPTPTSGVSSANCVFNRNNTISIIGGTLSQFSLTGNNLSIGDWFVGYTSGTISQPFTTINNKLVFDSDNQDNLNITTSDSFYKSTVNGSSKTFTFNINSDRNVTFGDYTLDNIYLVKGDVKINCYYLPPGGVPDGGLVIKATPVYVTIQGHFVDQNGRDFTDPNLKVTLNNGSVTPYPNKNGQFYLNRQNPGTFTVTATTLQGYTTSYAFTTFYPGLNCSLPASANYISGHSIPSVPLPSGGWCADVYFKYTPVGGGTLTPTPTPTSQPDIAYCNIKGDGYSFDITQGENATITIPKEILNGKGGPWAPGVRFVNPVTGKERRQAVGVNGESVLLGSGATGHDLTLGSIPARFSFPYEEDLVFTFYATERAAISDYIISNLLLVHEPTNDLDKDANCTGTLTINVKAKPTPIPTQTPRPTSTPTLTPAVTGVTIQGHHVDDKGQDLTSAHPAYSRTRVGIQPHIDVPGGNIPFTYSEARPSYHFTNIGDGSYTVQADVPTGYTVSYLYGTFAPGVSCSVDQSSAPTKGNTLAFTLPSDGWCADVYFKYTPTSSGGTSTPTPTPTVSQVEKPTGLAVTDSKCNDARTSASITFNWYHPTASSFKIGWRTKSESRITNFFTPTNPPPSPVFDPGSFTPNGYWTLTYPGFSPGVELEEWGLIATEGSKDSDPASSGGTVSARDCRLGGTPTPTLTLTPTPTTISPALYAVGLSVQIVGLDAKPLFGLAGAGVTVSSSNSSIVIQTSFLREKNLLSGEYKIKANKVSGYNTSFVSCKNRSCKEEVGYKSGDEVILDLNNESDYGDVYFMYSPVSQNCTPKNPSQPVVVSPLDNGTIVAPNAISWDSFKETDWGTECVNYSVRKIKIYLGTSNPPALEREVSYATSNFSKFIDTMVPNKTYYLQTVAVNRDGLESASSVVKFNTIQGSDYSNQVSITGKFLNENENDFIFGGKVIISREGGENITVSESPINFPNALFPGVYKITVVKLPNFSNSYAFSTNPSIEPQNYTNGNSFTIDLSRPASSAKVYIKYSSEVTPTSANVLSNFVITPSSYEAEVGAGVEFKLSAEARDGFLLNYDIDWGDGTWSYLPDKLPGELTVPHSYNKTGNYSVRAKVTTSGGGSLEKSTTVAIKGGLALSCIEVVRNGDSSTKLDVTFIPVNYKKSEFAKFEADVDKLISSEEGLLHYEPFASQKKKFNFHRVNREIVVDTSNSFFMLDPRPYTSVCNSDQDVVLINGNGRSFAAPGYASYLYGARGSVLTHEFGHAFGDLWDEYLLSDHVSSSTTSETDNCSSSKDNPPWKNLPGTGVFLECNVRNFYRSSENSLMRNSGQTRVDAFDTWNSKLLKDKLKVYE